MGDRFPVTTYVTSELEEKMDEIIEKAHKKKIRGLKWGKSSLIREIIERNLEAFGKDLLSDE